MKFAIHDHNGSTRISLSEQFTFTDNQRFKQIMDHIDHHPPRAITLDFAGVDFIDSAGLGMLLLLRDACHTRHIPISLESVRGQVKKTFSISRFDQLFSA